MDEALHLSRRLQAWARGGFDGKPNLGWHDWMRSGYRCV